MRAATGGPRSHSTPSRSRPQSTSETIPMGYDTNRLTDAAPGLMIPVHRFAWVPRTVGHRPPASVPNGTVRVRPRGDWTASAGWLLGAVSAPPLTIRVLVTPRRYGR